MAPGFSVPKVAKLEDQRGWERRAFLGALGDRSSLELQAKADRLRTILSRACEYLSADQLRKGPVTGHISNKHQ